MLRNTDRNSYRSHEQCRSRGSRPRITLFFISDTSRVENIVHESQAKYVEIIIIFHSFRMHDDF